MIDCFVEVENFITPVLAFEFLKYAGLPESRQCVRCSAIASIVFLRQKSICYQCEGPDKHMLPLFTDTPWESLRLTYTKWIWSLICILKAWPNNVASACGVSSSTISRYRHLILPYMDACLRKSEAKKIGAPGLYVELDLIIINNNSDKNWRIYDASFDREKECEACLLAGVELDDYEHFFVVVVPDRTIETLVRLMSCHVDAESIIITDDKPDFRAAALHLDFEHIVMDDPAIPGGHNIQHIWSGLKREMNRRSGVMVEQLAQFLTEYRFRRRFIKRRNHHEDSVEPAFKMLIAQIFM